LSDKNLENQEKPDVKEKIMLDLKRKNNAEFKKKKEIQKSLSGKNHMHALKFRLSESISFWALTAHSMQSFCPLIFIEFSTSFPQLSHFPIYSPLSSF